MYVDKGKAASATNTNGNGRSLFGRGVGSGRSASPFSRSDTKSVLAHTPPSLIEPGNRKK